MTDGESHRDGQTGMESRERPTRRRVEIHIFRHGEGEHQRSPDDTGATKETPLTPEGREQARGAAEGLFHYVKNNGGGIIAIRESPVMRTKETAFIFYMVIEELIDAHKGGDEVRLAQPLARKELRAEGVVPVLKKSGFTDVGAAIQAWLDNPDLVSERSPEAVAQEVEALRHGAGKLSQRVDPEGPPIHYAWITHDVAYSAFLQKVTGKTPKDLGGPIQNCEWAKLTLGTTDKEKPQLTFRGQEFTLEPEIER